MSCGRTRRDRCEGVADEAHDELVRGIVVELAGAPTCSIRPSFITATRSATSIASSWSCVTKHRRHVRLVVQAAQPVAQLLAHARVERAERLVEEQHASARPRARGRAPCAAAGRRRAARDSGRRARRAGRARAARRRARVISAFGRLRILSAERDVVAHRHVLERRVVLEDEADAALLRRRGGRVLARDADRAACRAARGPAMIREQRRLAAAARPEQRGQRARRATSRETSSSATKSPNRLVTLRICDRHQACVLPRLERRSWRRARRRRSARARATPRRRPPVEVLVVVLDVQRGRLRLALDAARRRPRRRRTRRGSARS